MQEEANTLFHQKSETSVPKPTELYKGKKVKSINKHQFLFGTAHPVLSSIMMHYSLDSQNARKFN